MSYKQAYRGLDKLNVRVRDKVELAMKEVKEKCGDCIFITETWRSQERQNHLRSLGVSRILRSKHQDGLAVDIAFKDDKRTAQIEKGLYPKEYSKWREVADIFNKYGMDWGFDLRKWDKPHFQDNGKPLNQKKSVTDKDRIQSLHIFTREIYGKCESNISKTLLSSISRLIRESGISAY